MDAIKTAVHNVKLQYWAVIEQVLSDRRRLPTGISTA
jgi:hypothetical protein